MEHKETITKKLLTYFLIFSLLCTIAPVDAGAVSSGDVQVLAAAADKAAATDTAHKTAVDDPDKKDKDDLLQYLGQFNVVENGLKATAGVPNLVAIYITMHANKKGIFNGVSWFT